MENKDLLKKIQALSFAKVEAELYLDVHPDSKAALDYYREILSELSNAVTKYQNENSPLFADGVVSDDWTWVKGKWPWQRESDMPTEDK